MFSQNTSDLYKKVDLILRGKLGFNIDSARLANRKIESKRLNIRDSKYPPAFPVILFNGKPIEIQKLNDHQLSSIKTIKVVKRDDPQAKSLFGSRGALGAIFISSKTYKNK
ncbi:MAG: hypothetical protein EOP45_03925 [Sphingobacteriaceae bacterium]|nr:MAG: hypothetical protein EOP45_03925 [Sphingobacteriaceae bacterium]